MGVEGESITGFAFIAWHRWVRDSGQFSEMSDEEYEIAKTSFINGYLMGFSKKITG